MLLGILQFLSAPSPDKTCGAQGGSLVLHPLSGGRLGSNWFTLVRDLVRALRTTFHLVVQGLGPLAPSVLEHEQIGIARL